MEKYKKMIKKVAYSIYLTRCFSGKKGNAEQDWFEAEMFVKKLILRKKIDEK